MSVTMTNGKPQRKQLSDQLDRLDNIIDVLADGLPEAVRDAVQAGTREAVKEAVLEILTRPELRALFTAQAPTQPATAPTASPEPKVSLAARIKAKFAALKTAITERTRLVWTTVTTSVRLLRSLVPLGKILAVGAGVGLIVGIVAYVGPHSLAAIVGGIGAASTTIVAQIIRWARQTRLSFGFGTSS